MYKLAKEMKDLGFPQPSTSYRKDFGWYDADGELSGWYNGDDSVYLPTTDEVIEELGEKFTYLSKYEGVMKYQAEYQHAVFGSGNTPLEALMRLYISVNGK